MRLSSVFTILAIVCIVGALLCIPIMAALGPAFGFFIRPEVFIWSFLILAPHALVARILSGFMDRKILPRRMGSALVAVGLSALGWLLAVWLPDAPFVEDWEAAPIRFITIAPVCWTGLMLVAGTMATMRPVRPLAKWLHWIGFALLSLVAFAVCVLAIPYPSYYEPELTYYQQSVFVESSGRWCFFAGFISIILLLVATFINRSSQFLNDVAGVSDDRYFIVEATCPRCSAWFRMASGGAGCPGCGLEITVSDA